MSSTVDEEREKPSSPAVLKEQTPHLLPRRSTPEKQLIQEFKKQMSLYLQDESFAKLAVKDWIELFDEFMEPS